MTIPLFVPHLQVWSEWLQGSGTGHRGRQKSTGFLFSSKFGSFSCITHMIFWSGGSGISVDWLQVLLFKYFEIILYNCVNAFEFKSQEFGVFALQLHLRTSPRWMTAPYLKTLHGMGTGGNKLMSRIIPLTSEWCSGLMWLLIGMLSSNHTSTNTSLYSAL